MDLGLSHKRVLVSGGTKGIGRAITLAFGREGAHVAVFASRVPAKDDPVQELQNEGRNAHFYQVDVSKESDVVKNVAKVIDDLGGLDILVVVAGITGEYQPVTKITTENLDNVLGVNLKGCVTVVRQVAKHMVAQESGTIVITSSTIVLNPSYFEACYRASKCAVMGFAETAALELACYGIRVNCVAPGLTTSPNFVGPILQKLERNPELKAELLKSFPLGRWGEPEDVAPAVLFLASDQAGFITGETVFVDGGFKLRPLVLQTTEEILSSNR